MTVTGKVRKAEMRPRPSSISWACRTPPPSVPPEPRHGSGQVRSVPTGRLSGRMPCSALSLSSSTPCRPCRSAGTATRRSRVTGPPQLLWQVRSALRGCPQSRRTSTAGWSTAHLSPHSRSASSTLFITNHPTGRASRPCQNDKVERSGLPRSQCPPWALHAASASGTSWAGTAITHACPAAVSRIFRKRWSLTQNRSAPVISSTALDDDRRVQRLGRAPGRIPHSRLPRDRRRGVRRPEEQPALAPAPSRPRGMPTSEV